MNLPTIVVLLVVAAVFFTIVASAVRNKKKGKSVACACGSCGGGCSGCAMSGKCHQ